MSFLDHNSTSLLTRSEKAMYGTLENRYIIPCLTYVIYRECRAKRKTLTFKACYTITRHHVVLCYRISLIKITHSDYRDTEEHLLPDISV